MTILLLKLLASLLCLLSGLWSALALHYQVPAPPSVRPVIGGLWLGAALAAAIGLWWRPAPAALAYALAFALLLIWWASIRPSNDRDWADEVARLAIGSVDGDQVTLAQVRNFDWRSPSDYEIRWEQRRYDLRELQSVDMILSHWGAPGIAHTLVSFGFGDGRYLVFSVEIRKERHEAFSSLGGFFKQFETSVIAADERDIVRVRTNVRGEDDYLYRVQMPAAARRSLLLAYVAEANRLARTPRFYNSLTANCTTIVYRMVRGIVGGLPLDHRLILSAGLPAYLHALGALAPGHTLAELRERGRITARARAADRAADFSQAIRRGVPGID